MSLVQHLDEAFLILANVLCQFPSGYGIVYRASPIRDGRKSGTQP